MLKNFSLTAKLSLVPAVALFGLVLYVLYTSLQLSATDSRLALLETRSYPTLEKTDAVIFQFSRVPALLNNAVAAGEPGVLDEARQALQQIDGQQQSLAMRSRLGRRSANEALPSISLLEAARALSA